MKKTNNILKNSFLIPKIQFPISATLLRGLFQETSALNKRLLIQIKRRPATIIAGILQPLLWLILFGALFQNAPIGLFSMSNSYRHFLTPGIIVFTAFTGALNAGLPLMFDKEFGFLNRLMVAPLVSQLSIVTSSAFFIATVSLVQTFLIISMMSLVGQTISFSSLFLVIVILFLLTCGLTMFSISLTFLLPGHIELLALIFVINLPLLFASTALVPFSLMPMWLQIMASLNPLSYAIETIRCIYFLQDCRLDTSVVQTIWGTCSLLEVILLSIGLNLIMGNLVKYCIQAKIK